MGQIFNNLTELVGKTPLVNLQRISAQKGAKAQVIAKVEFFNHGGSVKDRIALNMINDAESKGILMSPTISPMFHR